MKKTYLKPTMQVVHLQYQHQLLADSLRNTNTNLDEEDEEDELEIEDTPQGIWSR